MSNLYHCFNLNILFYFHMFVSHTSSFYHDHSSKCLFKPLVHDVLTKMGFLVVSKEKLTRFLKLHDCEVNAVNFKKNSNKQDILTYVIFS